ncbi:MULTISPECIES: putative phage tail protein [Bacteria]|uniref:putative phage tail protein n=1 Tax=Bacteria TaxID=2 RepID=UPI00266DCF02|nr:putative phage tail protein [Phascolarctobacterium faecium]
MEGLMNAEQPIYDEAETDTKFAFSRQFVVTADEKGVEQYEKILGIMPTATDSLEFRKRRVITRLSTTPPYTLNYLKQQLTTIFGAGNFNAWVDYGKRELYVDSFINNISLFFELETFIAKVKPANMIYIYRSLVLPKVGVSSRYLAGWGKWNYRLDGTWNLGAKPFYSDDTTEEWNYRLDGTWNLGAKPFATYYLGEIKMNNQSSITPFTLNYSASKLKEIITKVVINNTITVNSSDFLNFNVSGGRITFDVLVETANILIESVKIYAGENVIDDATLAVKSGENARIRFEIEYKEAF